MRVCGGVKETEQYDGEVDVEGFAQEGNHLRVGKHLAVRRVGGVFILRIRDEDVEVVDDGEGGVEDVFGVKENGVCAVESAGKENSKSREAG